MVLHGSNQTVLAPVYGLVTSRGVCDHKTASIVVLAHATGLNSRPQYSITLESCPGAYCDTLISELSGLSSSQGDFETPRGYSSQH